MSLRARISVTIVTAALVFVAAPPGAARAAVVSRGVPIPAFYTPPSTLPPADGTLIRTQPFRLALSLPGIVGPLPGRATRIMYRSTDSNGQPVAVTGAYVEPTLPWRQTGPRPLVVVAPGTMGQGDQCSTSLALQYGLVLGIGSGQSTVSVGYEVLAMYRLLLKGIAVVQTDYPGLGATDRLHTYVNRVDQGHAVLDAARAVAALTGDSSPVGLYGYSQGGGAVASAAELQPSYAPDVPLAATYAGAPPADLAAVTAAIDGTGLVGALGWAINGFAQSDPELRPLLDEHLTAGGARILQDLSTMCVGDAILTYAGRRTSAWTRTGESLAGIIASEPRLRAFVDDQRLGDRRPAGAIRVASGVSDNLVPYAEAHTMATAWQNLGAEVTFVPIPGPDLGSPLLNHFTPLLTDQATAVNWLTAELS